MSCFEIKIVNKCGEESWPMDDHRPAPKKLVVKITSLRLQTKTFLDFLLSTGLSFVGLKKIN